MKTEYKDHIRVWKADDAKAGYKKKAPSKRKETLPKDKLQDACDLALLISLEEYFQDISYESPAFLSLNERVKRSRNGLSESIQKDSDNMISGFMEKVPSWYKESKVIIDYTRHIVSISDGITKLSFVSRYERNALKIWYKVTDAA